MSVNYNRFAVCSWHDNYFDVPDGTVFIYETGTLGWQNAMFANFADLPPMTHGYCNDCSRKMKGELDERKKDKKNKGNGRHPISANVVRMR